MRAALAEWTGQYPEVRQWLGSVTPGAAEGYARGLELFMGWIVQQQGLETATPVTLLDYQDKAQGRDKVRLANYLGEWSRDNSLKFRPETVRRYHNSVRTFFSYNGVPLPRRDFALPNGYKEAAPQLLKREDVVKILAAAKIRDRAIYGIAFMGGMGYNEFSQFNMNWENVAPQLRSGADYVKVPLRGRKKMRGKDEGYFTLIMGDGLELLREYLKVRGEPQLGEPIFMRTHSGGKVDDGEPDLAPRTYRKNFETLCRRIGLINEKNTGRGSKFTIWAHQLRDAMRTEWQKSGADPLVAEFLMGHVKQVDPNRYLDFMRIPEHVVKEYRKALPRLNAVSNPDPESVPASKVEDIQRQLEEAKKNSRSETAQIRAELDEVKSLLYDSLAKGDPNARSALELVSLGLGPKEAKAELDRLNKEVDEAVKKQMESEE
jgi:hypothetical protein